MQAVRMGTEVAEAPCRAGLPAEAFAMEVRMTTAVSIAPCTATLTWGCFTNTAAPGNNGKVSTHEDMLHTRCGGAQRTNQTRHASVKL